MLAKDVMTTNVISVTADTTVPEIAKLLLERHISGVPVLDDDGMLIGLVSEGDLIKRAEFGGDQRRSWWLNLLTAESEKAREYVKTHGNHAGEVMTKDVATVEEDASLAEIATILEEKRIKRVPVMRDGKVVGIVSRSNLLQGLATANATPGPRPSGDVRAKIVAELDRLDFVHPTQMNVIVSGGVVELWGCLGSQEQKSALMVAVGNVAGAAEISDHVSVMPHYLGGV